MGRNAKYTPELADAICGRIAEGESLRAICRDSRMPNASTVLRWAVDRPEFQGVYTAAMKTRLDALAEDLLDISDNGEMTSEAIARDKLKVDNRKWLLARLMPSKYGDRIGLEHSGSIVASPRLDLSGLTQAERDQMRELLRLNDERLAARGAVAQLPKPEAPAGTIV